MPQHPMFIKYTREWLYRQTGFSKGYLSRVATGQVSLSRSFVERVCFKLGEPEEQLFLPRSSRSNRSRRVPARPRKPR
ncbi:MAG: hypothetical protein ACOC6S_03350 [Chloroflexota bacterium]